MVYYTTDKKDFAYKYIKRDIAGIICEKKNLEARNYYGYINLVP